MALEVMWYCGLRPCECFALNKSDIVDGYIDINKELGSSLVGKGEISRQPIIRKCKTEASVRKVPIPTKLNTLLKSYKVSGEKLFPNKDGNYFVINQVGCWFNHQKLEFNMYQLRHTGGISFSFFGFFVYWSIRLDACCIHFVIIVSSLFGSFFVSIPSLTGVI